MSKTSSILVEKVVVPTTAINWIGVSTGSLLKEHGRCKFSNLPFKLLKMQCTLAHFLKEYSVILITSFYYMNQKI